MNTVKPRVMSECGHALSVYVGLNKDSLDCVNDENLSLVLVIKSFGHFMKYHVMVEDSMLALPACLTGQESPGSFMSAGPSSGITIEFIQERNKKDKLFNDIISFLSRHGAFFNDSSELKSAKKLIHILRDILWYVNGYHHIFQNRALALPSIFSNQA